MDPIARRDPVISITSHCGNVTGSYNNVLNNCDISIADEKRAILEWLSPLDPRERHQAIGMDRMPGVGDWLLNTSEFTRWDQGGGTTSKPVLFCYGDPGVGKTYLRYERWLPSKSARVNNNNHSSLVIDKLCDLVEAGNKVVTCVYCDFYAQNAQSATGLLGAVLKQVVSALEPIPDEVKKVFKNSKGGLGGRRLLLPDILAMLVKSLSLLRQVFICIDALDEFPAKQRPELWESLQQIVRKCPSIRLFLTGRLHIRDEVQRYFPSSAEMLPISPSANDIGLYLRMRLNRDSEADARDEKLEADILRIIPEVTSGTFLLASLNMDVILEEATIYQRRQALHRMAKGLGLQDAYNKTLDRIRQQGGSKSRLGIEALMWISHCQRPLGAKELCHALGVEVGAEDFSIQNVLSIKTVLGYTLGLVKIDENASNPRLLHFTLQEYLGRHPTLFVTAHSMMAETCLTYLNSQSIRAIPSHLDSVPNTMYPFLEYATCFWGAHAARGVTEPVKSLALRLLDGYENHVSATVLWIRKIHLWWPWRREYIQGISGLHCIAFWGIEEIASAMLGTKAWDVNGQDSKGHSPLMWAVEYKNRGMVELFLEQEDIEPDKIIKDGRTVLSFAAELGNKDAVELLLESGGVNPNSTDSNGRTPLWIAVERGRESVVKLLLERGDVDPNSSDGNGRTPLLIATETGKEGLVKLLLEREDVDPNSGDNNGRTHISMVAEALYGLSPPGAPLLASRYEGILELLLEREDVDPNSPDRNGRTPLLIATETGKEGLVKLLLEREDVDPNSPDGNGRTPLSIASERRKEGIVKLLLERGGFNTNSSDNNGRTPLSFAAKWGWKGVVELLLKREDVDPDSPDGNGRTPLSFAAEKGQEGVVELLLEREDVDPNSPDSNGRTPLSIASERGEEGVVKLLLERGGADTNSYDNNGRTPLSFAAECGWKGVVELLLKLEDVDPDSPDGNGRTPLSFAAERGHEGIVKLLRERKDVDPNSPDGNGRTLLSFAAEWGWEGVVEPLLEREDVDPDPPNGNGRTPLSFAAEKGQEGVMKLLLEREDVDPNSSDNNGRTALSFAAERGEEGVVELLLEREDVDPNSPDGNGRIPLSIASQRGEEGVVKVLLEREDVDPNSSDYNGRTPLSFAAEWGHEAVVKLLLERCDVNLNISNNNGRTPLSFAASRRHEGVVKLLLNRGDVDPNSSDINGRTPLSFAIQGELGRVVEPLIWRYANLNWHDSNGLTPLSFVSELTQNPDDLGGYSDSLRRIEDVVEAFLARGDVDPNSPDRNGRTPLSFAAKSGCDGVVMLLLKRRDIKPDVMDSNGRTPLSLAAERGRVIVMRLLSDTRTSDHQSSQNRDQTAASATDKTAWGK